MSLTPLVAIDDIPEGTVVGYIDYTTIPPIIQWIETALKPIREEVEGE